jgi:hypothetical protein
MQMAFTLKARRALRQKRQTNSTPFTALMKEGEDAKRAGEPATACPYAPGSDDAEAWLFGYEG